MSVYDEFKGYHGRPISQLDASARATYIVDQHRSPFISTIINDIWLRYGSSTGVELSRMLTSPGSAWSITKDQGDQRINPQTIMTTVI